MGGQFRRGCAARQKEATGRGIVVDRPADCVPALGCALPLVYENGGRAGEDSPGIGSNDLMDSRIIESVAKGLGLPMDKMFANVDRYGNTSAASVAIALDEAVSSGKIQRGDLILMMVFGAGLTWGAAVIEW